MSKEKLKYLEIEKSVNGFILTTTLKIAISMTVLLVIGILLFSAMFLD
jgi:hypothetical protein